MKSTSLRTAEADAHVLAEAETIKRDPARLAAANLAGRSSKPAMPRIRTGITNRAGTRQPVKRPKKPANRQRR